MQIKFDQVFVWMLQLRGLIVTIARSIRDSWTNVEQLRGLIVTTGPVARSIRELWFDCNSYDLFDRELGKVRFTV